MKVGCIFMPDSNQEVISLLMVFRLTEAEHMLIMLLIKLLKLWSLKWKERKRFESKYN